MLCCHKVNHFYIFEIQNLCSPKVSVNIQKHERTKWGRRIPAVFLMNFTARFVSTDLLFHRNFWKVYHRLKWDKQADSRRSRQPLFNSSNDSRFSIKMIVKRNLQSFFSKNHSELKKSIVARRYRFRCSPLKTRPHPGSYISEFRCTFLVRIVFWEALGLYFQMHQKTVPTELWAQKDIQKTMPPPWWNNFIYFSTRVDVQKVYISFQSL